MAAIRDYVETVSTTNTASLVCLMPVHVTGDLLIIFANKDAAVVIGTPGGWNSEESSTDQAQACIILTKVAASGSETVTLTSTTETWQVCIVSVKGAGAVNASSATTGGTTPPFAGSALTTTVDNCLVFHMLGTDGGIGPVCSPGWINISNSDAASNSLGLAYSYKKTAGAVEVPTWMSRAVDGGVPMTIAIEDDGSGDFRPAYLDNITRPASILAYMSGAALLGETYPASLSLGTIGSNTTLYAANSIEVDAGLNPFLDCTRIKPIGLAAGTRFGGHQIDFSPVLDVSTGYIAFKWAFQTPKDYTKMGEVNTGGLQFVFRDAATYDSYALGALNADDIIITGRNITCIQQSQTSDTRYATSGTVVDTAVDSFLLLGNAKYGDPTIYYSHVIKITSPVIILGGTTSNPIDFTEYNKPMISGLTTFPLVDVSGVSGLYWAAMQVGGLDDVQVEIDGCVFQFPKHANGTTDFKFHVDENYIGMEFYGMDSNDSIKFTNCLFTSPSSYYWRFHSSASSNAVYDFSGSTIENATVTLRDVTDFENMKFISCSSFTQNSATIIGCTFINTTVTCGAPANASLISDSNFTSGGTGHALVITGTAANVTLEDVIFTGYSGTSTDAPIYVNIASGTMTISIVGTGTVPTIRTAGATVNVVSNVVTTTITVVDTDNDPIQNARVFLKVNNGDNFPYQESVTLSRSGSTVTAVHTGHGLATNDYILISGANEDDYNGSFQITVTGVNGYTYTISTTPTTPATGTIIATFVYFNTLTNASGIVTDTRSTPLNQSVSGWVRKSTGSPYYKTTTINDTVSNTLGLSLNIQMISDE